MTDWKWVRIPVLLHERLTAVLCDVESERIQQKQARTDVRFYEVFEMALNALERERNRGVDVDSGGPGRVAGDAGSGDVDGVDTAGGT